MNLRDRLLNGTTFLRAPDGGGDGGTGADLKGDQGALNLAGGDQGGAKPWYDGLPAEHVKLATDSGWDSPAKAFEAYTALSKKAASTDPFASLDSDQKGYLKTAGIKDLPNAIKKLISLEGVVGMERVALPPKDANGNRDWSKWNGWDALGRPKTADEYDLKDLELPEGTPEFQPERLKGALTAMHAAGYTPGQVKTALQLTAAMAAEDRKARDEAMEERAFETTQTLTGKWGQAGQKNADIVMQTLRTLGGNDLVKAFVDAGVLRPVTGDDGKTRYGFLNAPIAMALASVGQKIIGEGRLEGRDGGNGVQTPGDAAKQKQEFLAQPEVRAAMMDRGHPQHDATMAKLMRFNEMIANNAAAA